MSSQPQPYEDHAALVEGLAREGRAAQRELARMSTARKAAALRSAAAELRAAADTILRENARDLAAGESHGLSPALLDRL
jgi:glutamate-5-semialdehyde dehydrogenase